MSKTLHKIKQNKNRQKRRQSVVTGRQQLYCAVQSRSPNHFQTTTKKEQSSVCDRTSSTTGHSSQTTVSCYTVSLTTASASHYSTESNTGINYKCFSCCRNSTQVVHHADTELCVCVCLEATV